MKKQFALLLCSAVAASAQESAYQALRTLAAERGDAVYGQITAVEGRDGKPAPESWRVAVDDPLARGGVREFEIVRGKVKSEKAPIRWSGGGTVRPIDFSKLNLDSTGAFTLAEEEAVRARVGFDAVDYNLGPDMGGNPVWTLRLIDRKKGDVGTVAIGADSGAILRRDFAGGASGGPGDFRDDARYLEGPPPEEEPSREMVWDPEEQRWKQPGIAGKLNRFGERVKRHFYRAGGVMEQFFTGSRTLDRDYREGGEEPPPQRYDE